MDPELKSLLEENLRVSKETNALLKSMNRQAWWGFGAKVIFWIMLIIVPFFFIQALMAPYLELLQGASGSEEGSFDMGRIQELIDQYQSQ